MGEIVVRDMNGLNSQKCTVIEDLYMMIKAMTIRSIGRCSDYKSFVSLLLSHLRHPKGNEDWPASNVISSRAALGIVETWMV